MAECDDRFVSAVLVGGNHRRVSVGERANCCEVSLLGRLENKEGSPVGFAERANERIDDPHDDFF